MEELAARVRELAKGRFNATTLGGELGIPSSTAANYWSGKRAWPTEVLPDLAVALNTNVEVLMGRHALRNRVAERQAAFRGSARDGDDLVEIAQIDARFGAGGVIMDEHAVPEMRTFSRAWLRQITSTPPEELYWARPRGDSMAPTIADGEPILIDRRQDTVRDADLVWAFAWGDIGAVKRLRPMPDGTVKILSDNPAVPPDVAHGSEVHIFGRVVAVVKRL